MLNRVITQRRHAQANLGSGQARRPKQSGQPWVMKGKKRSEVDRRLDILVGSSGKLKDGSASNTVIGMLRLFNLCDVAPTITQDDAPRRERDTRTTSPVRSLAPAQVPLSHKQILYSKLKQVCIRGMIIQQEAHHANPFNALSLLVCTCLRFRLVFTSIECCAFRGQASNA